MSGDENYNAWGEKLKLLGVIIRVSIKIHNAELGLGILVSEILDLRATDITTDIIKKVISQW